MYTVEKQGFACVWECSLTSDQLVKPSLKPESEVIEDSDELLPKFFYKKVKRYDRSYTIYFLLE